MSEPRPNSSPNPSQGGGAGRNRRRRRGGRGGAGGQQAREGAPQGQNRPQSQPRPQGEGQQRQGQPRPQGEGQRSGGGRSRSRGGRTLTANQVLVKYDNLLDQHLITRRKYYDYFNRVDDRQLRRLEKNFFDSIEHLRRFEANLEPWQREALEKRKTERYRPDLTYSNNRGLDPIEASKVEVTPEEIEDPHFKETQKEAFEEYKEDSEESEGSYEDYLKYKGQA